MVRPAGVTVSAVFLVIGSLFVILLGTGMLLADRLVPVDTPQPSSTRMRDTTAAVVFFAGAIWGFVTSVGLFRMRRWARVFILVIATIAIILFGLMLLMLLVFPVMYPPLESDEALPMMNGILCGIFLAPIATGIWWLIYFNRAPVKSLFLQGAPAPEQPQRPLSITIIAWHAIFFGLGTLAFVIMRSAPYIFGVVLTGWVGVISNLVLAVVELAIGFGLLKLKPWGHVAGVWFCIFVMAQTLVGAFVSPEDPRMASMMRRAAQDLGANFAAPPSWSPWIVPVLAWGTFGVALWYLLTRKQAFLEAAKAAQGGAEASPAAPAS